MDDMNSAFMGFYATKPFKSKAVELTRKPTLPKRSCLLNRQWHPGSPAWPWLR